MANEQRVVKLTDGREVKFGKRYRIRFENLYPTPDSTVPHGLEIQCANGKFLHVMLSEIIEHSQFEIRGIKEKFQNEGSQESIVSDEDMWNALVEMHERTKAGTAFARESGPRGPRLDPVTIDAMMLVEVEAGSNRKGDVLDPNLAYLRAAVISKLLECSAAERDILPTIEEFKPFFEMARMALNRTAPADPKVVFAKFGVKKTEQPKEESEDGKQ